MNKFGLWLEVPESALTGYNPELSGKDPVGTYICSCCGEEAVFDCNDEFVLSTFCPSCGALMKGNMDFPNWIDKDLGETHESRKHGFWSNTYSSSAYCSECGMHLYDLETNELTAVNPHLNYCPNCGTKMDGKSE